MKIPMKNYIILVLLSFFTVVLTFYLMNKYVKTNNINIDFVSEIKENELDSYITEGHEVIVYMSKSDTNDIKKFEKELKKYTIKKDLSNRYVYLNLNNVSDNFYNQFYIKYINESSNNFKIEQPTFIYINDMKVKKYINNVNDIKIVQHFFDSIGEL